MTRVLVTGATGFIGRHLVNALLESGDEVFVLGRGERPRSPGRWLRGDLLDPASVDAALETSDPEHLYHLAGDPGDGSLEQALRNYASQIPSRAGSGRGDPQANSCRIVVPGSAAELGFIYDHELPATEAQPLRPVTPYGMAKALQSLIAQDAYLRLGRPVIRARIFNVTGPGEPASLVAGSLARRIARIERGLDSAVLTTGDLDAERDFLDVRDAARGLIAAAHQGTPGALLHLCSGRGVRIGELLEHLLARARVPVAVRADPERKSPVRRMIGRPTADLGWTPRIPLEQSLAELLDDWRARVEAGAP